MSRRVVLAALLAAAALPSAAGCSEPRPPAGPPDVTYTAMPTVPSVIGMDIAAAVTKLAAAGFQAKDGASPHDDIVDRQDPLAGALQPPGSTVTLYR